MPLWVQRLLFEAHLNYRDLEFSQVMKRKREEPSDCGSLSMDCSIQSFLPCMHEIHIIATIVNMQLLFSCDVGDCKE